MRLKPGEAAPEFAVEDVQGRRRALADYAGRRLLLSFYRYAGCPLCHLRIHELGRRRSEYLRNGLEVLGFFQSPRERVVLSFGDRPLPFPVVADPERRVYGTYGVESSWAGLAVGFVHPRSVVALAKGFMPGRMEGDKALIPADFVIAPDGTVETAYYGKNIADHLSFAAIESR